MLTISFTRESSLHLSFDSLKTVLVSKKTPLKWTRTELPFATDDKIQLKLCDRTNSCRQFNFIVVARSKMSIVLVVHVHAQNEFSQCTMATVRSLMPTKNRWRKKIGSNVCLSFQLRVHTATKYNISTCMTYTQLSSRRQRTLTHSSTPPRLLTQSARLTLIIE